MSKEDLINKISQTLSRFGFQDISYDSTNGFCATLLPYSNIRPFQKEKVRYYNITRLEPCLIETTFDKMYPVDISYKRKEILGDIK